MELIEKNEKRKISKLLLIILVVVLLITSLILGYFVLKDKEFFDITKIMQANNNEYTVLLNEFIVNIHSDNNKRNYLKIEMALMYTDKKDGKLIDSNINKIRDTIINTIMDKSSDEILDVENVKSFKEDIKKKINSEIGEDLIKDIYLTNLVIQ